jgi:CDP-paratose 2-epimerase
MNRIALKRLGVRVFHGDIRMTSDFDSLPKADWVIDAAANPSVLAGVGESSSRQLFEHNLASLVNVLEFCKAHSAGLILLSSSRVYSIPALASLPLAVCDNAFALDESHPMPAGLSKSGIGIDFSTEPPISLYGSTKLAAESVALEYGLAFDFPVWINRCGVLTGAGQFGTPDQGIFSYWLNAHLRRRRLRYIGFGGSGCQVRDAFHPRDLAVLIGAQIAAARSVGQRIYTAGGGPANAMSLAQLTRWCDARFGVHAVEADPRQRQYDIPWVIMDNCGAHKDFGWQPALKLHEVLEETAVHAEQHPDWLEASGL